MSNGEDNERGDQRLRGRGGSYLESCSYCEFVGSYSELNGGTIEGF